MYIFKITQENIDELIEKIYNLGGNVYTICGSLRDNYILVPPKGYKSIVIKERYLNEWTSDNICTMYHKLPKKYESVIELIEKGQEDKASEQFWK